VRADAGFPARSAVPPKSNSGGDNHRTPFVPFTAIGVVIRAIVEVEEFEAASASVMLADHLTAPDVERGE
jgi:hypothetical protein